MRKIDYKERFFALLGLAFCVAGAVLSIATIQVHRAYRSPLPSTQSAIGRLFGQLKEKGFPFSFLVISDTHNDENGYALLKEILKKNDASFLIHVGDAVSTPNIWRHRYFVKRMAEDIRPPFPVFLAPGIMISITDFRECRKIRGSLRRSINRSTER